MIWMQTFILLLLAAGGAVVVLMRDEARQAVAVCFFGLLLAVLFFVFDAPGVAFAEIVFGAVALPLTILLALARMRGRHER